VTIGSLENKSLNLKVGSFSHDPYKRAMSYQAFRACIYNYGQALPVDSDTSMYSGDYKRERAKYAKRLARAVAEESAEVESDECGSDDEFEISDK
jgi:hypothetical protein